MPPIPEVHWCPCVFLLVGEIQINPTAAGLFHFHNLSGIHLLVVVSSSSLSWEEIPYRFPILWRLGPILPELLRTICVCLECNQLMVFHEGSASLLRHLCFYLWQSVLMKLCLLFWNARTESEAKVGWIWNLCPAAFTVVSNPRSQRFRYCADEPRGRLPRLFGFAFFSYRYLWKFYVILILPVPPDHTLGHSLTVCLILLYLLYQWWVLSLPFWVFEIG